MCACLGDKVIETYIGVRTLEEIGVLCAHMLVFGGDNDFCVGMGGDEGGGAGFR